MSTLHVQLFGRFSVQCGGRNLEGLDAHKVQELFCYLLLHRDHPHPRETLAGLLWGDSSTVQSKKYLRQALWHLQTAVEAQAEADHEPVLLIEINWVYLNPKADLWLDVAAFEQAFNRLHTVPGEKLDPSSAQALRSAVDLYQAELLAGWYQDWCLYERERLQGMYLAMLDKLMVYCEAHGAYEDGLDYGTRILRLDGACERTHRRLMRLHYLAGDRAAALRQYERCVAALSEELSVGPARRTVELYKQIRADQLSGLASPMPLDLPLAERLTLIPPLLQRLKQLTVALAELQHQLQDEILGLEEAVSQPPSRLRDAPTDAQKTLRKTSFC